MWLDPINMSGHEMACYASDLLLPLRKFQSRTFFFAPHPLEWAHWSARSNPDCVMAIAPLP
jgi:hypothetical protein